MWDLNPNNTNGDVRSSSVTLPQPEYAITVRGYDSVAGADTLYQLFFKSEPGEAFLLFGSNTQGQLRSGSGSSFDDQFVSVTNTYQFISVTAGALDILPVTFRATGTPVPEMSALSESLE